MTLNASGLANIDKTGFSKFAITDKKDVDNTEPSNQTYIFIYCVEQTGTTKDPYIQLVHSAGAVTAPAQFRNQSIIIND